MTIKEKKSKIFAVFWSSWQIVNIFVQKIYVIDRALFRQSDKPKITILASALSKLELIKDLQDYRQWSSDWHGKWAGLQPWYIPRYQLYLQVSTHNSFSCDRLNLTADLRTAQKIKKLCLFEDSKIYKKSRVPSTLRAVNNKISNSLNSLVRWKASRAKSLSNWSENKSKWQR
jgi:hypothetical protein